MKIVERVRRSYKVNAAMRIVARGLSPAISRYKQIVLPYKVRCRSDLRIHFGCGKFADPRFFNVDARPFRHVHYVTSSPLMPVLPAQSAEMIYACHVFEHISHRQQLDVLRRWHELLKPGGELRLSVPDFAKIVDVFMRGRLPLDQAQDALMGGQDYPGNFHFALFTSDHLSALLERAGFSNIRGWRSRDQENWPRDWSWAEWISLNLRAEKP
jgi:predicted SAM-dependent methyltransferase